MILQQNITWKVWPRSCTSHEFSACTVLFCGSKHVCMRTASEQPTGHSGL